jgi:hypothetical protein
VKIIAKLDDDDEDVAEIIANRALRTQVLWGHRKETQPQTMPLSLHLLCLDLSICQWNSVVNLGTFLTPYYKSLGHYF